MAEDPVVTEDDCGTHEGMMIIRLSRVVTLKSRCAIAIGSCNW
ncbi:hypothetical protein ACNKHM_10590 [Shigella sonnei]